MERRQTRDFWFSSRKFAVGAVMHTENVVAKYYCQQFFNYFGRAAQVSHRLFALIANDN
jgi:hypothetical protein